MPKIGQSHTLQSGNISTFLKQILHCKKIINKCYDGYTVQNISFLHHQIQILHAVHPCLMEIAS